MISEKKKIIVQISNEKTSCKEIPSIKWLCMSGEKIPSPEVSGKKILIFLTNDHRTSRGRHSDVQL